MGCDTGCVGTECAEEDFFAGSLEPQSYQRLKQFRKTLFSVASLALCEAWFLFSQKFGELLHS
jgi:hypothetical protein